MGNETRWSARSWREHRAKHQPEYPDPAHYKAVLRSLSFLPPLVFPGEVDNLKSEIAEAASGNRFILHGGDCVERFVDCNQAAIANKLKILLQMSVLLAHAARTPVVRIGRMAGQYFKPRTNDTETVDGRLVPTYRGDTVNAYDASGADRPDGAVDYRTPDPDRLEQGYFHAAATLNYIRAMIDGGFADLHHPYAWNLHDIEKSDRWPEYREIVERILDAIHFMESFGGVRSESLGKVEFFTSHEGLHLGFEEAMTRAEVDRWYNLGAHFLWIGERTRELDGAHVEYFRGIENPIGIKLSAAADPDDLCALLDRLDPENEPGRITLITRLGAARVRDALPPLVEAVRASGRMVAWSCDPMHGNGFVTRDGVKTRKFGDILAELESTFKLHGELDGRLAGVHFELTGEPVTECTGGSVGLSDTDLATNYQTYCDPRLNYAQSLEMGFLIARMLRG